MNGNNKNIFVFDLHDTILEGNEDALYEILKVLSNEFNIAFTLSKPKIKDLMGIPLDKLFKLLYPDISNEEIDQMKQRFRDLSDEITAKYLKPIKGVIDLFKFIKNNEDIIIILTSAEEKYAQKMINDAGISFYIDELRGVEIGYKGDTVSFKTNSILDIKTKYSNKKLYMIGDKEGDLIAGRNAKITTIYFNPEGKENPNADILITDYRKFKMKIYDSFQQ
jgi:phosphoglycolate phosphatase-like HAD superfamily hydrolase